MNNGKVSGIALRRELMAFAKRRQTREDRVADQITARSPVTSVPA